MLATLATMKSTEFLYSPVSSLILFHVLFFQTLYNINIMLK